MPMVSPHTFQHFGLPVNDLKRAKEFYLDVVGRLHPLRDGETAQLAVLRTCPNKPMLVRVPSRSARPK